MGKDSLRTSSGSAMPGTLQCVFISQSSGEGSGDKENGRKVRREMGHPGN